MPVHPRKHDPKCLSSHCTWCFLYQRSMAGPQVCCGLLWHQPAVQFFGKSLNPAARTKCVLIAGQDQQAPSRLPTMASRPTVSVRSASGGMYLPYAMKRSYLMLFCRGLYLTSPPCGFDRPHQARCRPTSPQLVEKHPGVEDL